MALTTRRTISLFVIGLTLLGVALVVIALRSGGSSPRAGVLAAARAAVPSSISTSTTLLGDPCDQQLTGPNPDECYRTNSSPRDAIRALSISMRRAGFDNLHSRCIQAKLAGPRAVICQVWSRRSGYYARFAFAAETAAGPAEGGLFVSKRLYPSTESSGAGGGETPR